MKYPQIAGKLNWEETPECADGLFLQPEELTTLETSLAENAVAAETAATTITNLQTEVETATQATEAATTALTEKEQELATANERIAALETENEGLKKADGPGAVIVETPAADKFDNPKKTANDFGWQQELTKQA